MDIVTFLTSIISTLGSPAPAFHVGAKGWQNLIADSAVLPAIFLDEPILSDDSLKISKVIEEKYKLVLLFLNKTEPDFTPTQHGVICQAMRDLRADFIHKLEANSSVKEVSGLTTKNVMNLFDCNLSGVMITVNLILYDNSSVC